MAAIFSTVTMTTMTKVWSVCVVADCSLGNNTVMLSSWTLVHILIKQHEIENHQAWSVHRIRKRQFWKRENIHTWSTKCSQQAKKENQQNELALSYQFDTSCQSILLDRHRRVCLQSRCKHSLRCDKEMVVHKVMGFLSEGQIVCSHRHVWTRLPVTIQTLCECVKERRKTDLAAWGEKVPIPLDGIRTCTSGIRAHRASEYTTRCRNASRQSKQTFQTLSRQLHREIQSCITKHSNSNLRDRDVMHLQGPPLSRKKRVCVCVCVCVSVSVCLCAFVYMCKR